MRRGWKAVYQRLRAAGAQEIALKSTVAEQQKAIAALTASLKAQAAQIQKVSARVDGSQVATRLVSTNN